MSKDVKSLQQQLHTLKSENDLLKIQISQRDNHIKSLHQELDDLENENQSLTAKAAKAAQFETQLKAKALALDQLRKSLPRKRKLSASSEDYDLKQSASRKEKSRAITAVMNTLTTACGENLLKKIHVIKDIKKKLMPEEVEEVKKEEKPSKGKKEKKEKAVVSSMPNDQTNSSSHLNGEPSGEPGMAPIKQPSSVPVEL